VHTKSPSPAIGRGFQAVNSAVKSTPDMRINTLLNNEEAPPEAPPAVTTPAPVKKGPGRGNWRRNKKADGTPGTGRTASGEGSHHVPLLPNNGSMFVNETPGAGIPATPGSGFTNTFGHHGSPGRGATLAFQPPNTGDHVPTPSYQAQKRHRGVTQHQNAIINHRKQQIDYTLDRRIRKIHIRARDKREEEGAFFRAWKRIKRMPTDYDSEEEMIKSRKGRDRPDKDDDYRRTKEPQNGADDTDWRRARSVLAGFVRVDNEASDLGEEAKALARSLRQCSRRLDRWQEAPRPGQAVMLSRGRQADGLLYARRPSVSWEDDAIDDDVPPAPVIKKIAPKPRKSTGKGKAKAAPVEDVEMEDVGGPDGAGEPDLNEVDLELLGEVDADIYESDVGDLYDEEDLQDLDMADGEDAETAW
jgi:Ino eighty subunit 1